MKYTCTECRWHGQIDEIDKVKDPSSDVIWFVCPNCRTPEHIVLACEHDNCWAEVTCGTPTENGYKNTCYPHKPNRNELCE